MSDHDESNTENEERALAAAGLPAATRSNCPTGGCAVCDPEHHPRMLHQQQGQRPDVEKAYADHRAGVVPKPGGSGDFSIGGKLWPGLSKLAEESGEVIQVIGKLIGSHGVEAHWDGTNLRERLTNELGDLLAAVAFVMKHNGLDDGAIQVRHDEKLELFEKWHRGGQ